MSKREEFWIRVFLSAFEFEGADEEEAAKIADLSLIEYDRRWPTLLAKDLSKEEDIEL
jgi:hypothetical protein